MANGLIDFTARRVHGFGLGSQPILVLTASEIDFGSTPPERSRGVIIEGSIDRQSGDVRILVHASQRPVEVLIEFRLDCEFEQPIS